MRQEPEGFPEFWNEWRPNMRKTDGRGEARKTFAKHIKEGADPWDIVDGAKWFLVNLTAKDREYIPLASTWLNRCAYEDGAQLYREMKKRAEELKQRPSQNVVHLQTGNTDFLRKWEAQKKTGGSE